MFEKDDRIKVSVVIAVYNNEQTIERCLTSVVNQTLKEIEIIVVNDESTDKTREILDKYEKQYDNIHIIDVAHCGQGICRNIGIDHAKGEFIGFVDGDDEISEVMYETLYGRVGDADICQCNAWVIRGQVQIKAELKRFDGEVTVKDRLKYANGFFFKYFHGHGCCNKIFRKSFIEKNNIRFADNNIVYSEDLYFNIMAIKKLDKIVFVDEMLYYYYQYKTSHSHEVSIDKAKKLCKLFDLVTQDEYKYVFSRLGVLDICIVLAKLDNGADEILSRSDFRRLLKLALRAPEPFYQKVIIFSILIFKKNLSPWIIKNYYGRFSGPEDYI